MSSDNRSEDFLAQQFIRRIVSLDECRLDEIAFIAFDSATSNDLCVRAAVRDVLADLLKRALVNHCAHEIPEISRIAHLDLLHYRFGTISHLWPYRLRN